MEIKTIVLLTAIPMLLFIPGWLKPEKKQETATFAGGCFWCMEPAFEKLEGIIDVKVGYTGGTKENPTYEEVSEGTTGHLEAAEITFNPAKLSYKKMLEVFWQNIDPTDSLGQFVDKGSQYKTAIFYHSEEQRKQAEESKKALQRSGKFDRPIVTKILKATKFYPAEDYHQDFYRKDPSHYKFYSLNSGRYQFLKKLWGENVEKKTNDKKYQKPDKAELKKKLTEIQYKVTQSCGTEPAFQNEYWDNHREGIYVDVVTGEPLFSSLDKFDSGTGWPSFIRPLEPGNITEKTDKSYFMIRTEVKSKNGDSHLGHLFNDGPKPTGQRYCINSASLRFIPKEDLEKEGYSEYKKLFKK